MTDLKPTLIEIGRQLDYRFLYDSFFIDTDLSNPNGILDPSKDTNGVYVTMEKERYKLDGTPLIYQIKPTEDKRRVGLVSTVYEVDGVLYRDGVVTTTAPAITIASKSELPNQLIDGFSLYFDTALGTYPTELSVYFTAANTTGGVTITVNPTGPYVEITTPAGYENTPNIKVSFLHWSKDYTFFRLNRVTFGKRLNFTDSDILPGANINHAVSLLSDQLPIATLNFDIYSASAELDPLNPDGNYNFFQRNQQVDVFKDDVFLARYYLKSWDRNSTNEKILHFYCEDAISVAEETGFKNYFSTTTRSNSLTAWAADRNITIPQNRSIANIFAGRIDASTFREFAQKMIQYSGGYLTTYKEGYTQRNPYINLKTIETQKTFDLSANRIYATPQLNILQEITRIVVNTSTGGYITKTDEVWKGFIPANTTMTVEIPTQAVSVTASPSGVVRNDYESNTSRNDYNLLQAIVTNTTASQIETTLTASQPRVQSKYQAVREISNSSENTNELIINIEALEYAPNSAALTQLLDLLSWYYKLKYRVNFETWVEDYSASDIFPGAYGTIEAAPGRHITGYIESVGIDLSRDRMKIQMLGGLDND